MLAFATLQGTYTVFLIAKYVRPQVQTEIRQNPQGAIEQAQKRQRKAATAPTSVGEGHGMAPTALEGTDAPYAAALGGDFNPADLPPPPSGLSWRRVEQLLVQPLAAKYVTGIFTTIGMLVLLVQGGMVGPLKKRFGEVNLIIYGTLVMAFALALVPIPNAFFWQFPTSALTAIGNSISAPVLTALISILAPENERGEIIGVFQSSQSLGRILGPLIGGVLFNNISYGAPYFAGASIMIVAFIIALKLRSIEFHVPNVKNEAAPAES
jgi:MFS family permease